MIDEWKAGCASRAARGRAQRQDGRASRGEGVASSERGVAARDGLVVALDLTLNAELVREATVRELARAVQDLRKRAGLRYGEPVLLSVVGDAVVDEPALREQCSVVAVSRVALVEPLSASRLELGSAMVEVALARAIR